MSDKLPGPGDTVLLVDGSWLVFRAYFQSMNQDRKYNFRPDGLPTGAVRLFCNKLYQFIKDGAADRKATHLAIVFDKSEQSFRNELYADYKANRSEPPDDLIPQFPLMRAAVEAFGLTPIEKGGYEADDLIATYARQAAANGADVVIVSADKDLMQLVDDHIFMFDPASGEGRRSGTGRMGVRPERRIGVDEVVEYFGVTPDKVIDVQALVGDSTDNVPGVPGIGPKTAAQLLEEYGDLDTLLARAEEIKQNKRRENIIAFADQARLSRELVTLKTDTPVEDDLGSFKLEPQNGPKLIAFLKAMEFTTLTRRVAEATGAEVSDIDPASVEVEWGAEARGPDLDEGDAATPKAARRTGAESLMNPCIIKTG